MRLISSPDLKKGSSSFFSAIGMLRGIFSCLLFSSSDSSICLLKPADTVLDGFFSLNGYRSHHAIFFQISFLTQTASCLPVLVHNVQYLQNMTLFLNSSHGNILTQFAINLCFPSTSYWMYTSFNVNICCLRYTL